MSSEEEFAGRLSIDIATLRVWLDNGWIVPGKIDGRVIFHDVDMARAALICDLDDLMGINDEGIDVVLDLVDQLHQLRRDFDMVLDALRAAGS